MSDEFPKVEYCVIVEEGSECESCRISLAIGWPCTTIKKNTWDMNVFCWPCSNKLLADLTDEMGKHKER